MRILGVDPGLQNTGWGVIESVGNRLRYVADGVVRSDPQLPTAERLRQLFDGLMEVIERYRPDEAAVEETFVNSNPTSTLKLGHARAAALIAPAKAGLPVAEYANNVVKKAVVGNGSADKGQVGFMIRRLLPLAGDASADAADALAVAITHAHLRKVKALRSVA